MSLTLNIVEDVMASVIWTVYGSVISAFQYTIY